MLLTHNSCHQGTNVFDDMWFLQCYVFNTNFVSYFFNLIIPKSFLAIIQLNLTTITPPFLVGLINFYEEKKVRKELNQVTHEKFIFLSHLHHYNSFFFYSISFSLLFFSFDYNIAISFPFHFYIFNSLCNKKDKSKEKIYTKVCIKKLVLTTNLLFCCFLR